MGGLFRETEAHTHIDGGDGKGLRLPVQAQTDRRPGRGQNLAALPIL